MYIPTVWYDIEHDWKVYALFIGKNNIYGAYRHYRMWLGGWFEMDFTIHSVK